ncbi:hypothetical protein SARC_07518 [Sphaeroforma arctica JP610]|uniref:DOP1-like C-terminal domain-containing protein n=1 Tax=Sphaeroforma arctica JP610 TaxID=667725 RepID=A0A0L0FW16_9EUKA|nr:hypothetical protein SARC_07518 [Sphaeroforma arctica JP610]KNC80118.1 hypothetical protein SARC_07518 [Sphaeroforma arctica JP610]|eukprot:XP_014154020.1 hypothetical protein SARC_07518 [Sphaeroforma arctica JP610]
MRSDSAQNLKPGAKVSPNLQCRVRITDSQQALVDMLLQLGRDGRFRFLIQGIREIHTRSNSNSTHASAPLSIIKIAHRNEALLLQMLLCCTEQCDTAAVSDALGSILQLLGEITSSTNYLPSTSVCLVIIYTLATKLKSSMDHRHRRRLQELSYRLVSIMINSVTLSIGRESTLAANQTEVESKKLGQGAAGSAPGGATQSSTSPRSWPASRQVSDSGINSQSSTNQNTARQTPINEKLGTRLPTPGTKSTRSAAVSPPASSAAADYDPVGEALVVLRVYVMGTLNALHQKTEKDRVTLYLQPVMPSLAPLLKAGNHVSYKYKQELLQLFLSISTYAYALRSWKTAIYDLFMDTNYFKIKQGLIPSWRFLIKNMCALDKHVLTDIIEQTKTSSGQSTLNIFSSQAQELDSKSRLVKRTAFVIYCGTQDEYYQDIPAIMECIVDCLRPPSSPVVQERVFLLFRIMLLRMSEQHLLAWWPTALTEVVRVLDRALTQCRNHGNGPLASASAMNRNSTSSLRTSPVTTKRSMGHMDLFTPDDLHLLLGACKFVDLMILLPVQICHLHQWMFVDEIIHEAPNTPTPQSQLSVPTKPNNPTTQAPADRDLGVFASYMARLSDALSDGISPDIGASGVELADFEHGARGPLLTMREVSSASDLVPFFSTVSAFNIAADVTRSIPDYASIQAIIDIEFTEAS